MEKIKTRNIVLYLSVVVLLISITFKGSYAYFTAVLNSNTHEATGTAGTLSMEYQTSQTMYTELMLPISASQVPTKAEKSLFTLRNTGTVPTVYYLELTDFQISNNLIDPDFKWELLLNGTKVASGNFSEAVSGQNFIFKNSNGTTYTKVLNPSNDPSIKDEYELRIYILETSDNQNRLLEGSFQGKVKYTAVTGSFTAPN